MIIVYFDFVIGVIVMLFVIVAFIAVVAFIVFVASHDFGDGYELNEYGEGYGDD